MESTEIGKKERRERTSGIEVIRPVKSGEKSLKNIVVKRTAKMANAKQKPSPRAIIRPYSHKISRREAEKISPIDSL